MSDRGAGAPGASLRARGGRGGIKPIVVLFLPPALLLFTIFVVLPIGEAGWYTFFNWNGYGKPSEFVGLRNYQLLFQTPAFLTAFTNNLLIIAVSILVQIPLALFLANLISNRIRGAVAFRLIFFLPYVLADVAAGLIWRFVFDGDYGLVAAAANLSAFRPRICSPSGGSPCTRSSSSSCGSISAST